MADTPIIDLTEATSASPEDVFYMVSNPSGTPADRKIQAKYVGISAGNVIWHGADNTGATNSLAAFDAAVTAAGDGGVVTIPPGTYRIDGPWIIENDNLHIDFQNGATITATDSGSFATIEIDDTKVGMPQMKCMIAFRDCTGSSISGGGTVDASSLVFDSGAGEAGIFVRNCNRVTVEGVSVKNVWPSGYSAGGEGSKRYSGILFIKSTSCAARFNRVNHVKYDGISARMENTDILIYGNQCWDCYEGIQSSPQYADVNPEETNVRTVIDGNEVWDCYAQLIVFHSDYVVCKNNKCHSPQSDTQGIRAIGASEADIRNNFLIGYEDTSANIATYGFDAIRAGVTNPSFFEGNRIMFADNAILLDANVVFYPTISNNIIWKCNTGIDLVESTTTRFRRANISGNFIRAYRYGIRAQDTGPTIISGNTLQEESGWSGSSIGIDLDPNNNGDVEYVLSNSLPTGFDTQIHYTAAPNPATSTHGIYFAPDMWNANDRYVNRGVLLVSAGNTTGTDSLISSLSPAVTPTAGEIQVTQMSGPPVAFTWSATSTTLTITIASSQGSDCTFGWYMHLSGYVQA